MQVYPPSPAPLACDTAGAAVLAALMHLPADGEAGRWAARGQGLAKMLLRTQAEWLECLAQTDDVSLLRNAIAADSSVKATHGMLGGFPGACPSAVPAKNATLAYLKTDRLVRQASLLEAAAALRALAPKAPEAAAARMKTILDTLPPFWHRCQPDFKD